MCNLMDVHLGPTDFRQVAWADHEYPEWPLQRLVPSIAERFARSYVTCHDRSASRPSTLARVGFGIHPRVGRRDPCVNGFEALCDCGCCEPLDAFLRTGSKAGA